MAIELYQQESERRFCHFVTCAHQKLVNFVESRKQMTTESYKFFVEHAYNQFVTHEAFHTSAISKTKAKDITGHGVTHVSTKLFGYVWIGSKTKLVHTTTDQADDVTMEDVKADEGDETDRKANELPNLEVKIEREEEQEPHQVQEESVGSLQGEETSEEPGDFGPPERPEFPKGTIPQDRYGNFIMSLFSVQEYLQLRQWVFDLSSNFTEEERRDQNLPLTPEQVSTMAIALFTEVIATESHQSFMTSYPQFTQTDVDPDTFLSIQLSCRRIQAENEHITIMAFLEEDNPEIPEDPESKKEIERMTPENKHLILETDNSSLIDCTVQWMNMLNEDLQKRIVERVSFVKKEVEEEQDVEEKEEETKKEPEVPPITKVSISTQTDLPGEVSQSGCSHQREAPASDAGFCQREGAKEEKSINDDDTAPPVKKPATLLWYGQDITGNEEDSILRELSHCFSDGYHSIWAGFCNLGFPAFPSNRHLLWHKKYRQTDQPHQLTWFDVKEEHMMEAYVARHKDESVKEILEDAKNNLAYGCSDPRLHIRARESATRFTNKATGRHQEDFESLHSLIDDYTKDHHEILCSHTSIAGLQILGSRTS